MTTALTLVAAVWAVGITAYVVIADLLHRRRQGEIDERTDVLWAEHIEREQRRRANMAAIDEHSPMPYAAEALKTVQGKR